MQAFRMSLQEMYNSAGATKQTVMDKTGCASARGVKKPWTEIAVGCLLVI